VISTHPLGAPNSHHAALIFTPISTIFHLFPLFPTCTPFKYHGKKSMSTKFYEKYDLYEISEKHVGPANSQSKPGSHDNECNDLISGGCGLQPNAA
jgi:hypothetical protein